jgi:hypothetical protein
MIRPSSSLSTLLGKYELTDLGEVKEKVILVQPLNTEYNYLNSFKMTTYNDDSDGKDSPAGSGKDSVKTSPLNSPPEEASPKHSPKLPMNSETQFHPSTNPGMVFTSRKSVSVARAEAESRGIGPKRMSRPVIFTQEEELMKQKLKKIFQGQETEEN